MEEKKIWTAPALQVYGDIEEITGQAKCKQLGSSDDFATMGIIGVSDATYCP